MQYDTLEFEVRDGVAHVTLNRPRAGNSINLEMGRELLQAALRCDEDPSIRAVVLAGSGNAFCVGGDLKDFAEQGEDLPRLLKELTAYLHGAISRMTRMDPPVVAAVHGAAAGGGVGRAGSLDPAPPPASCRTRTSWRRPPSSRVGSPPARQRRSGPPSGCCTAAGRRRWRPRWSTRRGPSQTSRARPTPARGSPPSWRSARHRSEAISRRLLLLTRRSAAFTEV